MSPAWVGDTRVTLTAREAAMAGMGTEPAPAPKQTPCARRMPSTYKSSPSSSVVVHFQTTSKLTPETPSNREVKMTERSVRYAMSTLSLCWVTRHVSAMAMGGPKSLEHEEVISRPLIWDWFHSEPELHLGKN